MPSTYAEILEYNDISFRLAPEPTQPPIHSARGALAMVVKWQGCEVNHSLPTSSKVKKTQIIRPLTHTLPWHRFQLIKHKVNFTFTLLPL
jgi:hypothetical protein